jgi:serine/threonine-protein kinase
VHRDLKPENVFLVRPDAVAGAGARIKILDFGLARLLDGQAITTYGLALGTPSFMSPEQAAGRLDEIDGRTDLFALAATGFRLRTGRRIHEAANPVELVQKMATLAAPPIRSVVRDVSEPYARVVDRALAFRRDDRYPDAEAMQRDLQKALAELDAGVAATQLAVPAPVPQASLWGEREPTTLELSRRDLEPRDAAPARPRRRRSLLPWFAVLLFGGIGVRLWLDARAASPSAPSAAGVATPASPSASVVPRYVDAPNAEPTGPAAAPASPHPAASATAPSPSASAHARPMTKNGPADVHKLAPHKGHGATPAAGH